MRLHASKHSTEAASGVLSELFVCIMSADARVIIKNPRELKDASRRSVSEGSLCCLFPASLVSKAEYFSRSGLCEEGPARSLLNPNRSIRKSMLCRSNRSTPGRFILFHQ